MNLIEEQILELIPNTQEPALAISQKELAQLCGLSSRSLRGHIREIRKEVPICSNAVGYYISSTEEIIATINRLQTHIKGTQKTIDNLEAHLFKLYEGAYNEA